MRNRSSEPTFGQMFGFMLDSLFMDQLHSDLERINHYNDDPRVRAHRLSGAHALAGHRARSRAGTATSCRAACARCCGRIGANNSAGTMLLSYLLFERGYTRELIALGRSDARARAEEIRKFLALRGETSGFLQRVVPGEDLRIARPESAWRAVRRCTRSDAGRRCSRPRW